MSPRRQPANRRPTRGGASAQPRTVATEFGLRCPACRRDDGLEIELTSMAVLTPAGTVAGEMHDWDGSSFCQCSHCDHTGDVWQFRITPQGGEP